MHECNAKSSREKRVEYRRSPLDPVVWCGWRRYVLFCENNCVLGFLSLYMHLIWQNAFLAAHLFCTGCHRSNKEAHHGGSGKKVPCKKVTSCKCDHDKLQVWPWQLAHIQGRMQWGLLRGWNWLLCKEKMFVLTPGAFVKGGESTKVCKESPIMGDLTCLSCRRDLVPGEPCDHVGKRAA